jgi:hypothetical protein
LKKHLPASGLTFFPKSGHVLSLEEPELFGETAERFIALAEPTAGAAAIRGRCCLSRHCEPVYPLKADVERSRVHVREIPEEIFDLTAITRTANPRWKTTA